MDLDAGKLYRISAVIVKLNEGSVSPTPSEQECGREDIKPQSPTQTFLCLDRIWRSRGMQACSIGHEKAKIGIYGRKKDLGDADGFAADD
jgi:hypothetical protein